MTARLDRPPDAQTVACPCRHGDVPAEIAGQRPLLARAVAGDPEAFARLYDAQVEGIYRYLLGWTGDRSAARDLTEQVFRGALAWLAVAADGEGDLGAWLIAMARDALAQRRGSAWLAGPAEPPARPPRDPVEAVAFLGDPEREVVVLRLLLGHSLAHTAHLSGYSPRAVMELQLAACQAVWELTGGRHAGVAGRPAAPAEPEEFERRLGRWEIDLAGADPALADALAVANSLRLAAPRCVVAPDHSFVERLREALLAVVAAPPADGGRAPRPSEGPPGGNRRRASRGPWVATGVATAAIVGILTLQALEPPSPNLSPSSSPPSACADPPCAAPTTAAPPTGAAVGTPLTTILGRATTSSLRALVPQPAAPRVSAPTTPPTTRPATTAPPTTRPPAPTTTRAPTTTAPTTTTVATTTTVPTTTT